MPFERNHGVQRERAKRASSRTTRLWYAARVLRTFTLNELMAVAEIDNRATPRSFINTLTRAGYFSARRSNSALNRETTYRLARNTGPICPAFLRKSTVVYDFNTRTEYPVK